MENKLFLVLNHRNELMVVVAEDRDHAVKILVEKTFIWRKICEIGVAAPGLKAGFITRHSFWPNIEGH